MFSKAKTRELFRRLSEVIDPKPELEFANAFQLLVAVVLSAQTTDRAVNQCTRRFFPERKTPQDFLDWGLPALEEATKTLGLYHNKSRAIIGLCEKIQRDFQGEVPRTREELMTLPGVGWKTASVVMNIAFDAPTVAVDTHIFRVANRTGLAPAKTPEAVSRILEAKTPKEYLKNAHHYLLLHGRYTCTARNPKCEKCAINALCAFRANG
jgi:endonuclease III